MSKCILFAGPIGSGKSPIANYLSYKLNLPVFNNDSIRIEVKEDLLAMDENEYENRRSIRIQEILNSKIDFIYDASIDRKWYSFKQPLKDAGYTPYIISLNFSKEKLTSIYKAKGYIAFDALDRTIKDHSTFLESFKSDILLNLEDTNFKDRLELSYKSLSLHMI